MAHQLVNVRPAPRDEDAPASLTLERALQILLVAAPHLPKERQISLLAMALGTASSLPPHKAITTPTAPLRLPFAPEVLRGVIQAKTVQHFRESDSAFEAKQRATRKASTRSGGSKGITKRYQKPQKTKVAERRASAAVISPGNTHITPYYGVLWNSGVSLAPRSLQVVGTVLDSTTHSHCWDSKDPLSGSIRKYSPA